MHYPYRALSTGVRAQLVRPALDDARVVDEDFLLSVDLPPRDVQRGIAVKLGRNYLVQLLERRRHVRCK